MHMFHSLKVAVSNTGGLLRPDMAEFRVYPHHDLLRRGNASAVPARDPGEAECAHRRRVF